MSRNGRKPHEEEHADESWLVPYADILTLLLALFLVLFATAKVDQQKFAEVKSSMNGAFNGGGGSMIGGGGPGGFGGATEMPQAGKGGYSAETDQLTQTKNNLDHYISSERLNTSLETELLEEGLLIRIRETALFPSGSANLLPESRTMARDISKMLEPLPQKIVVSGHTDNVPINNSEFQSNWDLGTQRSLNFLKLIFSMNPKLKPEHYVVSGNGEYSPIAANSTDEGRAKNRRVEVLILRSTKVAK